MKPSILLFKTHLDLPKSSIFPSSLSQVSQSGIGMSLCPPHCRCEIPQPCTTCLRSISCCLKSAVFNLWPSYLGKVPEWCLSQNCPFLLVISLRFLDIPHLPVVCRSRGYTACGRKANLGPLGVSSTLTFFSDENFSIFPSKMKLLEHAPQNQDSMYSGQAMSIVFFHKKNPKSTPITTCKVVTQF